MNPRHMNVTKGKLKKKHENQIELIETEENQWKYHAKCKYMFQSFF
jgi:hypothetical protein